MEWHELPKYNGMQVSQLIYMPTIFLLNAFTAMKGTNLYNFSKTRALLHKLVSQTDQERSWYSHSKELTDKIQKQIRELQVLY